MTDPGYTPSNILTGDLGERLLSKKLSLESSSKNLFDDDSVENFLNTSENSSVINIPETIRLDRS